jgi:hypothetical protein
MRHRIAAACHLVSFSAEQSMKVKRAFAASYQGQLKFTHRLDPGECVRRQFGWPTRFLLMNGHGRRLLQTHVGPRRARTKKEGA